MDVVVHPEAQGETERGTKVEVPPLAAREVPVPAPAPAFAFSGGGGGAVGGAGGGGALLAVLAAATWYCSFCFGGLRLAASRSAGRSCWRCHLVQPTRASDPERSCGSTKAARLLRWI